MEQKDKKWKIEAEKKKKLEVRKVWLLNNRRSRRKKWKSRWEEIMNTKFLENSYQIHSTGMKIDPYQGVALCNFRTPRQRASSASF